MFSFVNTDDVVHNLELEKNDYNIAASNNADAGHDLWAFWHDNVLKLLFLLLLLLFLTFSVLVANPKKLLYTVANPARGLLNREKRTKKKSGSIPLPPPTPDTARSEEKNISREPSTGATQVSVGFASVQGYLRLVD